MKAHHFILNTRELQGNVRILKSNMKLALAFLLLKIVQKDLFRKALELYFGQRPATNKKPIVQLNH